MNYFRMEKVSDSIVRIIDSVNVAMYLVIGETSACLIDTGCGFGDLKSFVETITDKPIIVVLTHAHLDHSGAASLFDTVYLSPKELEVYKVHGNDEYRSKYFNEFAEAMNIQLPKFNQERIRPFEVLNDNQIFDLGGVSLKFINVPGHTPGIMKVLIPELRTVIFGDACGRSVLLFEDWSEPVSSYKNNLLNFKTEYENDYDIVLRNHGSFESNKIILDNVIACCEDVLSGVDDKQETYVQGELCYRAKATDKESNRIDGVEGNVVYRFDKNY